MMRKALYLSVGLLALGIPGTTFGQLMQYWPFDADTSNSVSGGLEGTTVGTGVSIGTGAGESYLGGGALKVSHDTASGDYFHIEGAVIPDYNPCSFTISTWYKYDAALGTQAVDSRNFICETFPTYTAGMGLNSGTFAWYNEGAAAETGGPTDDGQWHHVAMVYSHPDSANPGVRYYYDGILYSGLSSADVAQPITGMNIGNHRAGDGSRNWRGYIDDFAVYNGTIDDLGIWALYSGAETPETVTVTPGPDAPAPIPTSPLQAHWTFDSNYSSTVNNEFYEGIPHGDTFTSITNTAGEFIQGTGALKLDSGPAAGNGTFVEIPREVANVERDKQITISAWYNYSDISGDGSDDRNFVWEAPPLYSLSFSVGSAQDAEWYFDGLANDTSGPAITEGEWNHVVMVLDTEVGRAQFYHNGELRDDVPVSGDIPEMTAFHIGNHRAGDGTRDFDGFIDDVAVYHGVLTADAVAGLYDGIYSPETVPVTANLPEFPPADVVEEGWTYVGKVEFDNPQGIVLDEATGKLYVGRRGTEDGDGIFEIAADGTATAVVSIDNPAALVSLDGSLYVSLDYPGEIHKINPVAQTSEPWINDEWGTPDNDDDTTGMCVVPDGYAGPDFGGLVTAGQILAVDRGSGDFEEVWVFSPSTMNSETRLVSDSDPDDRVGAPFADLADVTIADDRIFVADWGDSKIYEITGLETAVELTLTESIGQPRSLVTDPLTDDLLVLTSESTVVRIDIATGEVSTMIENIAGVAANSGYWDNLEISSDGTRLFLLDFALDYIYEFQFGTAAIEGDLNGDGFVGSGDLDIVRANWGQSVTGAANGDPSGDGTVGSADLDIVRANWGAGTQPAAVPEPSTLFLLLAGIVAAVSVRRRK